MTSQNNSAETHSPVIFIALILGYVIVVLFAIALFTPKFGNRTSPYWHLEVLRMCVEQSRVIKSVNGFEVEYGEVSPELLDLCLGRHGFADAVIGD